MIRLATSTAILLLAVALTACGADQGNSEPEQAETSQPPESEEPEAADDGDMTEDLRNAAKGSARPEDIVTAIETEPGRLEVKTNLIDPRGENGSPEAQTAVAICEAAVSLLKDDGAQEPYVGVLEKDGTSWVLYGHPAYPDGCTEV